MRRPHAGQAGNLRVRNAIVPAFEIFFFEVLQAVGAVVIAFDVEVFD